MVNKEIKAINEKVKKSSAFVDALMAEIKKVIVGQDYLIHRLMIGLLSNGHVLLEGVPGLGKTLAVNTLAKTIKTGFQRIQFTPDLLPADLVGTLIYNQKTGSFVTKKGPIFSNIILADEINRAPAKVQSALLEAMQERQVTLGEDTYKLADPFLVLATQNPIEQEGTYPLPEAQVDRFMLKLKIDYPSKDEEKEIINRFTVPDKIAIKSVVTPKDIMSARSIVKEIYVDEKIANYVVNIVFASRNPEEYGLKDLKNLIDFGASPRASLGLILAAKANAFLKHRGYVTPEDIRVVGHDILRHRLLITYEAEAENISSDEIITKIFDTVEVP